MKRSVVVIIALSLALLGSGAAWYRMSVSVGGSVEPWTRGTAMPTARSEMPAAVLDGLIYVPGGLGAFGRILSAFEAYDAAADEWVSLAPLPEGLHHAGAAAADGRIYLAGGYSDLGFTLDNPRTWAYEPDRDRWQRVSDMPGPRAAHALVALDDLIYAVGGAGARAAELWAYDPEDDNWRSDLAAMPTAREHLTAVAAGGLLFAIGGREGGGNLPTVEIYDPAEDAWTRAPDMPSARSGLSAATVAGEIHVAGGEDLQSSGTFEAHEIFDPETGEWREGIPLSAPRHGLASAAVGEAWYVIGGATRAGAETVVSLTDSVDILRLGEEVPASADR